VAALECVDHVLLFAEDTPHELLRVIRPDVLVKGGDWPIDRIIGRDVVERRGGTVKTIPLVPGMSTTALIQRIRSQAH
jgi:bifunctional ADP-heptose synthase (sugar kinase/adenylyltransferase)